MTSVEFEPFAHLIPDARKVLDGSEAARFAFIGRDKLIETPALRHPKAVFGVPCFQQTVRTSAGGGKPP